jgi:CheY-like chemotaxis protein
MVFKNRLLKGRFLFAARFLPFRNFPFIDHIFWELSAPGPCCTVIHYEVMAMENRLLEITQKNKTILVIDDDADVCALVCDTLEQEGYNCLRAGNGLEGMNRLRDGRPDAVVLDVMLPDKSGVQLCGEISEDASGTPVIVLTVKQDLYTKINSFRAGAKRYLTKPFDIDDLIYAVEKTLRQKEMHEKQYEIYDSH